MAFVVKNRGPVNSASASKQGYATISQWIQTSCPAKSLPATTTDQVFRVRGGRVLVYLIIAEVTTIIQAQATTVKFTSKRLDNASVAVGSAVDLSATTDLNALEVGGTLGCLGSGAAGVKSNAGAVLATLGQNAFVVPQGEIYVTTGATSTGAMKYDIYYQPLDPGAYVDAVGTATVAI